MSQPKSFMSLWLRGWGWVSVVAAGLALILLGFWSLAARDATRLADSGVESSAQVTGKRFGSGSKRSNYQVTYTFKTQAGESISDRQSVSGAFYTEVQDGQTRPVRYWQDDPNLSEIEIGAGARKARTTFLIMLVPLVAALFTGYLATQSVKRAQWLRRHGVERRVLVAAHIETNTKVNTVRQWRATWQEPDGKTGQTRMARKENLPAIGAEITIFADPTGKLASVWAEDA